MDEKFLKKSTIISDEGAIVGKMPDELTVDEWYESELTLSTGLQAIRENCYECSGNDWSEVKKCQIYNCVFWPLRMGKVPKNFRKAKEKRDE